MNPRVELIHFEGCPHADEARRRLKLALAAAGLDQAWDEWDIGRAATPETYRRFGSPTILVNGTDVAGGAAGTGMGCVVAGAPAVGMILSALQGARP